MIAREGPHYEDCVPFIRPPAATTAQPSPAASFREIGLLSACITIVLGTLLVDPSRLRLLVIPFSFLLAAYGGSFLFERFTGSWLPEPEHRPMLDLATRIGGGIAVVTFLAIVSASAGLFRIAGFVTALFAIVGLSVLVRSVRFARPAWDHLLHAATGIIPGLICTLGWLWCTIPPTFYDELVYHLVIPQQAIATESSPSYPWVFFTLMPYASDLLLAWGLALGSDLGSRAMHWSLWVACIIAVWGVAETATESKVTRSTYAFVTMALATSPTFWFLGALPFAETSLACAILTATAVIAVPSGPRRPWLALGLLLGFAGAVKLSGLPWIATCFLAAWIVGWPFRDLFYAGMIFLVGISPWWGRAYLNTGNPIHPLGYRWFGDTKWSERSEALVKGDLPPNAFDLGGGELLRLPLDLIQSPERFGSASDVGVFAVVSVGVVLLLPLIARLTTPDKRQHKLSDGAAMFMSVSILAWAATSTTVRFFAPGWLFSIAVVTSLAAIIPRIGLIVAAILLVPLSLWGTMRFLDQHQSAFSSLHVALGQERPHDYLVRYLGHYEAAHFVQETVQADARLLFIGETRPYYFARNALAPTPFDLHPLSMWIQDTSTTQELVELLNKQGITHVVLSIPEFKRLHKHYRVLAFDGELGATHDARLRMLPSALHTLFSKNGVYVLEVPNSTTRTADTAH